jgi:hypothetical protein
MFVRPHDALRRSVLGMIVADLSFFLALCALMFQQPWVRLAGVLTAIAIPWFIFLLTRAPIATLAFEEWRSQKSRSIAALLGVAFGTAALCVAVGVHPSRVLTDQLIAQARGGPADLIVEAPSEAAQNKARQVIETVRAKPDMQLLFDAEPLELKWAPAWIEAGATHRIRIVEFDPLGAVLFGGDRRTAGLAKAKPGLGATVSSSVASALHLTAGQSVVLLSPASRFPLVIHQVLPDSGLIGLPNAEGQSVPTLFVDPASFVELRKGGWSEPIRYWSVISLCGTPDGQDAAEKAAENPAPTAELSTRHCSADSLSSLAYVDRVEQELNAAIDEAVARDPLLEQQDDAGKSGVLFGAGPASAGAVGSVRVDPIKQLAVNQSWTKNASFAWDNALVALLGTGAVCAIGAACFVDRRRRSARERMVGMSGPMVNGMWTGVIGLSAIPGAVLGAVVGTVAQQLLGWWMFRGGVPVWSDALRSGTVFPSGLALAIATCSVVSYLLSVLTQRIPLISAVRGAPLMTAARFLRPAVVLVAIAAVLAWRSRLYGWHGQLVVILSAFGLCILLWSLAKSKQLIGAWGAVVSIIGLLLLRRSWGASGSVVSQPLIVFAVISIVGGLVGAYVATAPGQHFARFGVPRADATALSALRTRVATRPGPWPLLPLTAAVLAMSATATAASVVVGNATAYELTLGQRNMVVLQEFLPGTVNSVLSAVPALSPDRLVSVQMGQLTMSVPSLDPLIPAALHRRSGVAMSLPDDQVQRIAVVGTQGANSYSAGDFEGVVVVAESTRRIFGVVPPIGSTVTVRDVAGREIPLVVRAVIERAPASSSLLVNSSVLRALTNVRSVSSWTLALPAAGQSLGPISAQLKRAVVGRQVSLVESFTRTRPTNAIERFGSRTQGFIMLLNLLSSALLVWRWADERRRLLLPTHVASIGPTYIARSINQDATAHVGVSALLGGGAGLAIGWALMPPGGLMHVPLTTLAATVLFPTVLSAVVARFPSGDASNGVGHASGSTYPNRSPLENVVQLGSKHVI